MKSRVNLRKPSHAIAAAGGLGLFPFAPGSFGSLLGYPAWLLTQHLSWQAQCAVAAVLYLLGVWAAGRTARELEAADPPEIVWDEVVGCYVALLIAPADWRYQLLAFGLFRALDILKPGPISTAQRAIKGGNGIMLDDLLAGLGAGLLVYAVNLLL